MTTTMEKREGGRERERGPSSTPLTDLCGEGDILERLILTPGAHDVREGAVGVLVDGGGVAWLAGAGEVHRRQHEGQDAIHKHQELRVFEVANASL